MRRLKGGGLIRNMAELLAERMKRAHKVGEPPRSPGGNLDIEELPRPVLTNFTPEERAELAKSRVYVRAPRDAVSKIAKSGEILTQHEVPSSRGYYDPEYRKEFEHRFFGIPYDAPVKEHPKYGYVSSDPYGRAIRGNDPGVWNPPFYLNPYDDYDKLVQNILEMRGGSGVTGYGPLSFMIKKSENPRITYTPEDSLDAWWTEPRMYEDRILKATNADIIPRLQGKRHYVEAQIHGRVPLSSVEKVIDYRPDPDSRTRRMVEDVMKIPYENVLPQESLQRYVGVKPLEALDILNEEMRGRGIALSKDASKILKEDVFGKMQLDKPVRIEGYFEGGYVTNPSRKNVPKYQYGFKRLPSSVPGPSFAEGGPITPELLESVKMVESGGDPRAVGPLTKYGRAQGAYQFLPQTAREWGVDPFDPESARQGADKYLNWLYGQTGSLEDALVAYNWGIGNLKKFGKEKMPLETRSYVKKVLERLAKFQAGEQPTLASAPHNPVDPVPSPETKSVSPSMMMASSSNVNFISPQKISPPPSVEDDPMKDVNTILRDPMKFATSEA